MRGLVRAGLGCLLATATRAQLSFDTPADSANYTYTTTTLTKASVLTTPPPGGDDDFSSEALARLWLQVGPVVTGPVTAVQTPGPDAETHVDSPFSGPDAATQALHPLMPGYLAGNNSNNARLPAGFRWGVSSSAYQIEGAADADGRGPSTWDFLAHRVPNFVRDNTTGDVAAAHYYLYKQDMARLAALGVPSFAFSISWPRIFPFGARGSPVNMLGVEHYDDVIRTARAAGLAVDVTLFHWDTPLALVNAYGSWSSREIVDDFVHYAQYIIRRYDALVDGWFTINEPQYCRFQYQSYPHGTYLPAYRNITTGAAARFACGHHALLAHAAVAKWYHGVFGGRHNITFKNSGNYLVPANASSPADQAAVQRAYDFGLGWFGGPWSADGDYPASLRAALAGTDVLPALSDADKALIRGSCDLYAIDAYSSFTVAAPQGGIDACVANASDGRWPECFDSSRLRVGAGGKYRVGPAADPGAEWLVSAGIGVRRFLGTLATRLFPTAPAFQLTEFGFAEPFESLWTTVGEATWDVRRADYFQAYLDGVLAAVVEDGVPVTGAWAWAIFDNFEWREGNRVRFGLQYVNFSSLERTPKVSMFQLLDWFRCVCPRSSCEDGYPPN